MKKRQDVKKDIDNLWSKFCKRELTLDQLIDEVNKIEKPLI